MWPDGFPAADYVRQARRLAGLSQRDLAARTGVSKSLISRIEAGHVSPRADVLERLLAVAGMGLVVVREVVLEESEQLEFVPPLEEFDGPGNCRDGAGRRYPAHLPLVVDPVRGEWWADRFGLLRPPETFYRDQTLRTVQRSISQWDVRPHGPRPRWPLALARQAYARQRAGNRMSA